MKVAVLCRLGKSVVVGLRAVDYQRGMNSEDWGFCKQALQRFSRTFAVPIALLPPQLERTVTCAYLLCRISDTIEDTEAWTQATRERLFRDFLDVLTVQKTASDFAQSVREAGGHPDELELLLGVERVLRVFAATPEDLRRTCCQWIGELTLGMDIFGRRSPGGDGIRCLLSGPDLDRYCFFVAGAIGHLLTESSISHVDNLAPDRAATLRENAECFGMGLQLVNILRDIRADLQRDCCFIPRTLLQTQGLTPAQLAVSEYATRAGLALQPLFDRARSHLRASLAYALAIPATEPGIRQFCLVPLWLAIETLELCAQDPVRLLSGERVKVPRQRVTELVQQCVDLAGDDDGLRLAYSGLSGQ